MRIRFTPESSDHRFFDQPVYNNFSSVTASWPFECSIAKAMVVKTSGCAISERNTDSSLRGLRCSRWSSLHRHTGGRDRRDRTKPDRSAKDPAAGRRPRVPSVLQHSSGGPGGPASGAIQPRSGLRGLRRTNWLERSFQLVRRLPGSSLTISMGDGLIRAPRSILPASAFRVLSQAP